MVEGPVQQDATLPPRERYDGEVSLTPEEVIEAFATDDQVAWYPNADPPAFADDDAPPFEAWPMGTAGLMVRHRIPPRWHTASPYVFIELEPLPSGGTRVRARFQGRPTQMMFSRTTAILGGVGIVLTAPLLILAFAGQGAVATIFGIFLIGRYLQNRPSRGAMLAFGAALRALIGRKFVPHGLGSAEGPFRHRPLGDGS